MRKSAVGALTGAVSAIGIFLSSAPGLIVQGATGTATPLAPATLAVTPIATNGTVLIAPLAVSGGIDPTTTIRTALSALPSVPVLKNLKLTVKAAPKPFTSIDEALAAAKTPDIVAVVWLEAAADTSSAPILYFALPRRQYFESLQPALRENTTGTGVITLPGDIQLPFDTKLDAKTLTAYTQAQLYVAFADYPDAHTSLQSAQAALAANTAVTMHDAIAAEITFEQAFLDGKQLKSRNLDAALSSFTDLSKNSSVRSELQGYAFANLAALYIDQGDNSSASDAVTSALAIDNNLIPALLAQGSLAFQSNDLSAASDSYSAVLTLDPNNIYALNNRGWSNYLQNQVDSALTDFTEVIKIDPNFVDAYLNRASVYRLQQDFASAIDDVNTALRLDPNYEYAYSVRGNLNVRARLYDAALADLTKAISLNPDQSVNYENRGFVWEALGEPDKAFADYSRAIRLAPSDPYPYLYRGNIYLQRGDYYNALVDEALAIQFNTGNSVSVDAAYFFRAQAYRGLQRWSSALADYQKYINVTQNKGNFVELSRAYIKAVQALLTPTPSPTDVPTSTNTPTSTPLPPTATMTATATATLTATATTTATPTLTATATSTLTITPSSTLTVTPTVVPSKTQTPLPSSTDTATVIASPTAVPTQLTPSISGT